METIDISKLSDAQRKALFAQMKLEEKREEEQQRTERKTYKELRSKAVEELTPRLKNISSLLTKAKADVYNQFASLLELKADLYAVKESQKSHTFSNEKGDMRISIGYRTVVSYDDTVNEGIALCRQYIDSLAKDSESATLIRIVNNLLKRDKDGSLKSNRVMELSNIIKEYDNTELLKEGLRIITEAMTISRTLYFVEAQKKNEAGGWENIALSISSVDFPSDFKPVF